MLIALAAATTTEAGLPALLAVALAAIAAAAWRRLRGTTLAAPAAWAVASAAAIAAVELALLRSVATGSAATLGASLARYAAAVGTFCPMMAVLGAKRPQDRGWQWIVFSLWIVLLVPAGQAWAAHTSNQLVLPAPWRGLLAVLIVLTPLNYLPTRWGAVALLVAAAQAVLLKPWLTTGAEQHATSPWPLAMLLVAALPPMLSRCRRGSAHALPQFEPYTQRWLAFRNGWGAFWALRVLNRINETAELSAWPARLQWSGFAPAIATEHVDLDDRNAAHIQQTMDTLLRRFERPEAPSPI